MEQIYTIERIRKTVKMEASDFANLVGISEERIKEFEQTGKTPTADELKRVLNALSKHYRTPNILPTIQDVYVNLLQQIADTLWENIDKMKHKFLPQFDAYIELLYRESRNCILLGLSTAALATLCVLLEYVVKDLVVDAQEKSKGKKLTPKEEKQIEKKTFGQAITLALEKGVISKEEEDKLRWMGEWVRNPLMHSKLLKVVENDKWNNVQSASMATGVTKITNLNGRDHKFVRKQMKIERDKIYAWPFFLWVEEFMLNKYADIIQKAHDGKLGAMFKLDD